MNEAPTGTAHLASERRRRGLDLVNRGPQGWSSWRRIGRRGSSETQVGGGGRKIDTQSHRFVLVTSGGSQTTHAEFFG